MRKPNEVCPDDSPSEPTPIKDPTDEYHPERTKELEPILEARKGGAHVLGDGYLFKENKLYIAKCSFRELLFHGNFGVGNTLDVLQKQLFCLGRIRKSRGWLGAMQHAKGTRGLFTKDPTLQ